MSSLIRYKLLDKSKGTVKAAITDYNISFDYPCPNPVECSPLNVFFAPGRFRIEVWGAQGGSRDALQGGKGGYSSGQLTIKQPTSFFLNIGGSPSFSNTEKVQLGGYNGGGNGMANSTAQFFGCGGGGATDLRLEENDYYSRIITAGGGGGCGCNNVNLAGAGGGESGENGITVDGQGDKTHNCLIEGGNQSSHGFTFEDDIIPPKFDNPKLTWKKANFGNGASWLTIDGTGWSTGGGGGGWFGGGHGCVYGGGGAGGSGNIFTKDSIKLQKMKIPSKFQFTEPVLEGGKMSNGNQGNGHATITVLEEYPEYKCRTCGKNYPRLRLLFVLSVLLFSAK